MFCSAVFVFELSRMEDIQLVPEGDVRMVFQNIYLAYGGENPFYDQLKITGDYHNADILLGGIIMQRRKTRGKPYRT